MAGNPPVTKEEALGYDHDALLADIERKKGHILTFQETIEKEKAKIEWDEHIIVNIDPEHHDTTKLKKRIEDRRANIQIFIEEIKKTENEIEREKEMVRIIEENKKE